MAKEELAVCTPNARPHVFRQHDENWGETLRFPVHVKLLCCRLAQLCLPLVLVAAGCCSLDRGVSTGGPAFSEDEIRSKTWEDSDGRRLQFLEWSSIKFAGFDELVLARYGELSTGYVTCLEFFHVVQRPEGTFLSLEQSSHTAESAPLPYVLKAIPERRFFILLEHDYKPTIVTSVKPEKRNGEVYITILRETVPEATDQRKGLRYTLVCSKEYKMRVDLAVGTWDIPDRRPHN